MMKNRILILTISFCALIGCSPNEPQDAGNATNETGRTKKAIGSPQLNITILLDLSDRIDPIEHPSNPEHSDRDLAIVNYFTEVFRQDMETKGAFSAKGKMKVIFSPQPKDGEINSIASKLNIDLSKVGTKEKKQIFDNISSSFSENLSSIYSKTIQSKKWVGSDIWRFFKNDVVDYCIEKDKGYRNILVLITDGYIYHDDTRDRKEKRSTYLTPKYIYSERLNLIGDWDIVKKRIEKYDYGYLTVRQDLEDLEVLVLEINPTTERKNDEDVIKEFLSKWFDEMHVKRYGLYNSDLPEFTKTRIENFLQE